jgi:hypothetical protein
VVISTKYKVKAKNVKGFRARAEWRAKAMGLCVALKLVVYAGLKAVKGPCVRAEWT